MQAILRAVGLRPTTGGVATISAELEPDEFQEMFGVVAMEIAPQPPGKGNFGKSGGYVSPELKVPAALSEFVESISAAPGYYYLQK